MSVSPKRKLFSVLSAASFAVGMAVASVPALAQSGLTLFSGVKREFLLPHSFDFDAGAGGRDRYRLRIPRKKMLYTASSLVITYPSYFKGEIDLDRIEIFANKSKKKGAEDEPVAIEAINPPELVIVGLPDDEEKGIDDDFYRVEILLLDNIPQETEVEIVMSNVKNPRVGQTYYFNARVQPPRDIRERYVGTWIVSID